LCTIFSLSATEKIEKQGWLQVCNMVEMGASGQRATWWNCCGLFDEFSGSDR